MDFRDKERYPFREVDLIQLLRQIFERHPEFRSVGVDTRISDRMRVDFVLEQDETLTLVEVKRVVPQTDTRFETMLDQLHAYKAQAARLFRGRRITLALVVPGALIGDKVEAVVAAGFLLWDRDWIMRQAEVVGLAEEAERLFGYVYEEPRQRSQANLLQARLHEARCGRPHWPTYQKLCGATLEYLFCPPLEAPISESSNAPKVNRRDFVIPNYAPDGFWQFLRSHYRADYIVVDAKNNCGLATKMHILQLANYLSHHGTGLFGMIVTRNGMDGAATYTCREQWVLHNKMIITLNDADLLQMLETKKSGDNPDVLVRQKVEDFRLGM